MFRLWDEEQNYSAEQKWNLIRKYRDELLNRCNWTQLPDTTLTFNQRTAWIDYRQSLRELEETFQNPDDVVFPGVP